jgi:hypothetical protein
MPNVHWTYDPSDKRIGEKNAWWMKQICTVKSHVSRPLHGKERKERNTDTMSMAALQAKNGTTWRK